MTYYKEEGGELVKIDTADADAIKNHESIAELKAVVQSTRIMLFVLVGVLIVLSVLETIAVFHRWQERDSLNEAVMVTAARNRENLRILAEYMQTLHESDEPIPEFLPPVGREGLGGDLILPNRSSGDASPLDEGEDSQSADPPPSSPTPSPSRRTPVPSSPSPSPSPSPQTRPLVTLSPTPVPIPPQTPIPIPIPIPVPIPEIDIPVHLVAGRYSAA